MVKFTRKDYGPDDPIFHGGVQVFVPISRPVQKDRDEEKQIEPENTGGESNQAELSQSQSRSL